MASAPLSFVYRGRNLQPVIETAQELARLPDLEDAHWVATAAPVQSFRADPVLLAAVDSDGDGRIRSDELRAAIRWLLAHLSTHAGVKEGNHRLALSAIAEQAPDGPALVDAARLVLARVGAADATELTLEQVRKVRAEDEASGLSAAGKVLPAAAGEDATLAAFLADVVKATGGEPHPSGEAAVTAGTLDRFLAEAQAWLDWFDQGQLPAGQDHSEVLPLGADTGAALAAVQAIRAKMEQLFLLCDAVHLDPSLADKARVDPTGTDLLDPAATTALLSKAPLAPPTPAGVLDLDGVLNPAWAEAVRTLDRAAVRPLLGEDRRTLDRAAWADLQGRLAAHEAWLAARPATGAADLGADALRASLADPTLPERTRALLAQTETVAKALAGVQLAEKLLLFQGGLLPLARSFAAMPDLYDPQRRALFEYGHLVMDGRVFDFCVRVVDPARHEGFGARSPIFIMYVMVGDKGGTWTDQYAVPVTAGERGHLVEGMWGVFFDRDGKEQHAQIRKIAVSPISIKEALFAPFKKIEEAMQKAADAQAASSSADMSGKLESKATSATTAVTTSATTAVADPSAAAATTTAAGEAGTAAATETSSKASGLASQLPMLVAGAGIALAALASAASLVFDVFMQAAGALATALTELPFVAHLGQGGQTAIQVASLPVAVILVLCAVVLIPFLIYAIPVSIATWLRLRKRDLSVLLEGAGWAVNTRQFLDKDLAHRFTRRPPVPPAAITRG